jgi:hypothetical protein
MVGSHNLDDTYKSSCPHTHSANRSSKKNIYQAVRAMELLIKKKIIHQHTKMVWNNQNLVEQRHKKQQKELKLQEQWVRLTRFTTTSKIRDEKNLQNT